MAQYYLIRFGAAYGEGAYGAGTYDCAASDPNCTMAAPVGSGSPSGGTGTGAGSTAGSGPGSLADTGIMVIALVTVACLLVFVSLVVRFWRRKLALVPVPVPDDSKPRRLSE